MEPLSAGASIITVLELSTKIIKYINAAAGATKDRKTLRDAVRTCSNILQQLKDEADDSDEGKAWSETIKTLETPDGPLGRLRVALILVNVKLQPKGGMGNALKWPFREKEVHKMIQAIEREKALLSLALENNTRKLLQNITKQSKESRQHLTELIDQIKMTAVDNLTHYAELTDTLSRVQVSQSGLQDGVDRIQDRQEIREAFEERQSILRRLKGVDYASQQHDFIRSRRPGTGQWLLESKEYQDWLKTRKQTLFCPGIPGAGKTILTSIVIGDICEQYQNDPTIGLAYIYCNFRRGDDQRFDNLLVSLLKQLVENQTCQSGVLKELSSQFQKMRTDPSLKDIIEALQSVTASYSRVFILMDALEEFQAADRQRVLSQIFALQDTCGINIFATSRFIPEIVAKFHGSSNLEIRASKDDIESYLDGRIDASPSSISRNQELRTEVKTGISDAVDGMFLLARIFLDSLDDKITPRAVRSALKRLRKQTQNANDNTRGKILDEAYNEAMERITGQMPGLKQLALQVLSWITCAKRPLTQSELQHALAVEIGDSALDESNMPEIEDIVAVCAGLVTVDAESDVIRLVHYTTQEYFERTQTRWFPDAETEIAEVCAAYQLLDVFKKGPYPTHAAFDELLRSYALYKYAAMTWGHHARVASSTCAQVIVFLASGRALRLSVRALLQHGSWDSPYYGHRADDQVTGLHMAAYFGMEKAAITLLEQRDTVDATDAESRTPLSYAAGIGHEAVVKLLLNNNAAIDQVDNNGRTPLSHATKNGHKAIIKLLLNNDAAIDYLGNNDRTPLSHAAENGHEAIVKLLLNNNAAIDHLDDDDRTPLSHAAANGHEAVVKLLLNNNAAIDCLNNNGRTPLQVAAGDGYEAIVKLLLDKGASIDLQDNEGRTALSYAAFWGQEATVKLLLDNGVATDLQDNEGRTALSYAAFEGRDAIVMLLLDKGHGAIVKRLLYGGHGISYSAGLKQTALSYDAEIEHKATIKLLLDNGVAIDLQDEKGRTALLYAVEKGHEALVKLLLDSSASTDLQDGDGDTALMCAVREGHVAIVKLLLDNGASTGLQDDDGETALSYAERTWHEAIATLLRENIASRASRATEQTAQS